MLSLSSRAGRFTGRAALVVRVLLTLLMLATFPLKIRKATLAAIAWSRRCYPGWAIFDGSVNAEIGLREGDGVRFKRICGRGDGQ